MFAIAMVYAGLTSVVLGLLTLLRPMRFLGVPTRQSAAIALIVGLLLVLVGFVLPAREVRVATARTALDRLLPAYQFYEVHSLRVDASPARVYRAIQEVTAGEIRLFSTLTWLRRFGRSGPESILNAPEDLPIFDVATRTGFLRLADVPDHEIVVGTVVVAPEGWSRDRIQTPTAFASVREPGFALAAMNFLITPDGRSGVFLSTETRTFATDASARRRFAAYWRVIYAGSALIRTQWLRAVQRRAEGE